MRAAEEGGRLRQSAPGLEALTDAPCRVLIAADENPHKHFHITQHPGKQPVTGHTCLFRLSCMQRVSPVGELCQLDNWFLRGSELISHSVCQQEDTFFDWDSCQFLQRGLKRVLSDISYRSSCLCATSDSCSSSSGWWTEEGFGVS